MENDREEYDPLEFEGFEDDASTGGGRGASKQPELKIAEVNIKLLSDSDINVSLSFPISQPSTASRPITSYGWQKFNLIGNFIGNFNFGFI